MNNRLCVLLSFLEAIIGNILYYHNHTIINLTEARVLCFCFHILPCHNNNKIIFTVKSEAGASMGNQISQVLYAADILTYVPLWLYISASYIIYEKVVGQ